MGRIAALVLALSAVGCDHGPTQLVVLVDTDFRVPDELASVNALVLDPDGNEVSSATFAVTDGEADPPTRFALPLSFGVVPVGGDADRRVLVKIMGLDASDEEIVHRRARTGFLRGRSLLLPMFLPRSCERVVCEEGFTCTEEGCVDENTDPMDLDPVDPGGELDGSIRADSGLDGSLDGGALEAGVDGGGDSGMSDAGVDASRDAGPPPSPSFGGTIGGEPSCAGATAIEVSAPVPVGATVVVVLAYRGTPPDEAAVLVTDTVGTPYARLGAAATSDERPRTYAYLGRLTAALAIGDRIEVEHPAGFAGAVLASWLERADPARAMSVRAHDFDDAPSASATTLLPGLLFAVLGTEGAATPGPSPSWTSETTVEARCGGGPGDLDLRSFHRAEGPGMYDLAPTLSMSRPWVVTLLSFQ